MTPTGSIRAAGLIAALLTATALPAGCGEKQTVSTVSQEAPVVPELDSLPPTERGRLMAWLFCYECVENEQDSALAAFRTAVPVLDRLLTNVPPVWIDAQNQRLQSIAAELQLDSAAAGRYRDHYLRNFTATVQSRTALLLGRIADPAAIAALRRAADSGTARGYRDDVTRTVSSTLAGLARRGLID